jgi:hypothetical protein
LRLVPPPFLCAICCHLFFSATSPFDWLGFLHTKRQYLVYAQSGKNLAVSQLAAIAHLGLVLKNNDLLTPAISLCRSQYLCPLDKRLTDGYLIIVSNKQYSIQFDSASLSRFQMLYIYRLTLRYFILLAAGFNNSVNFKPPNG